MDSQSLILDQALAIRAFEQQMLKVYATGQVRGTVHTCVGQEILPAAICHFSEDNDWIFGGHRAHGYYLARTQDFVGLAAEIFGKQGATSEGIGGSQHLHAHNFYTNGIQAGMMPIAAGVAEAIDSNSISICVIGDGTLGEGLVYETLNFSSLHNLPMLTIVEDNGIAQTTPQEIFLAGTLEQRAKAFDVQYFFVDSQNFGETLNIAQSAISYVRTSRKPALLHVRSYRLNSHSKGDDNRSPNYISQITENDYINKLVNNDPAFKARYEYHEEIMSKISTEVLDRQPATGLLKNHSENVTKIQSVTISNQDETFLTGAKRAQKRIVEILDSVPNSKFIGEDILANAIPDGKSYGGAFGVSGDLSNLYPGRVITTPISESFIAGFGIGRALAGSPSVVEIMFGDFSTLIVDQIRQQASKIPSMYGKQIDVPVLYRLPMGGRRGYGPTHSQNYEGMFFGIANTIVLAENGYNNDSRLYHKLLKLGLPSIVIESKDDYSSKTETQQIPGYTIAAKTSESLVVPWKIQSTRISPTWTIVTYGHAAKIVEEALKILAKEHEIFAEVLIFDIISPIQIDEIVLSASKTRKILVVEESIPDQGLTSLIVSEYTRQFREISNIYSLGGNGDIGASIASETNAFLSSSQIIDFILNMRA